MKQKMFLATTLLSVFAITSCGGQNSYEKVYQVTYQNSSGSTIQSYTSSLDENRVKIATYKFDSQASYQDQIKGFTDTWYVGFTYQYDIVHKKSIDEPGVYNEINVNLITSGTKTATVKMLLQKNCGVFSTYDEAFVNLGNSNAKYVSYTNKTIQGTSKQLNNQRVYAPISEAAQMVKYFNFSRNSQSQQFIIEQSGNVFSQSTAQSCFVVPAKNDSVYMTYTYFPKA